VRPRLLDLFCGAGGAAMGYHRSGFDVVGVDIVPQPNYPFEFIQYDALDAAANLADFGEVFGLRFDAIHASPPCQAHSTIGKQVRGRDKTLVHSDLVSPTRNLLIATGLPYVIENVPGAPLIRPVTICGSSVGLDVRRHRLFETNWTLMTPPCAHGWQWPRFRSLDQRRHKARTTVPVHGSSQLASVVGVHGHLNYAGEQELRKKAMGIAWMSNYELTQAIPPVYTELIGYQLLAHIKQEAVA
jgi:DNA (cytosine-5)-methyltransferase 1